jgi:hypothetical protein
MYISVEHRQASLFHYIPLLVGFTLSAGLFPPPFPVCEVEYIVCEWLCFELTEANGCWCLSPWLISAGGWGGGDWPLGKHCAGQLGQTDRPDTSLHPTPDWVHKENWTHTVIEAGLGQPS